MRGRLPVHAIELTEIQQPFSNESDVDVAGATAIATVRQAADEIDADETLVEMALPCLGNMVHELQRSRLIGLAHGRLA